MNKIKTLKGFTVPKGHTLVISKQDGTFVEKHEGERSGGQYSLEEVRAGADPNWELVGQGATETVAPTKQAPAPKPSVKKEKQKAPEIKYSPEKFAAGDFSGLPLSDEVVELLENSHPKFLKMLSKILSPEMLPKLTEKILLDSAEFKKFSEYYDADDSEYKLFEVTEKLDKYGRPPFVAADLALNTMLEYPKLIPRLQKRFGNPESFMKHIVDNYGYATLEREKVEDELDANELPQLVEGQITADTFKSIFDTYKNPANIRKIFQQNYVNPNHEEAEALKASADELRDRIAKSLQAPAGSPGKMGFKELSGLTSELSAMRKRIAKIDNTETVKAFRSYIKNSNGRALQDFLHDDRRQLFKKGIRSDAFSGMEFVLNFVHEDITPHQPLHVEKTDKKRASAGATSMYLKKTSDDVVAAHEFGHVIEQQNPSVLAVNAVPFLASRIDALGEVSLNLSDTTGNSYEPWEEAFEDDFPHMYAGKIYSYILMDAARNGNKLEGNTLQTYAEVGGIYSTEVVSMGMENMYKDPFAFVHKDPGHFEFIMSLRTSPRILRKR